MARQRRRGKPTTLEDLAGMFPEVPEGMKKSKNQEQEQESKPRLRSGLWIGGMLLIFLHEISIRNER